MKRLANASRLILEVALLGAIVLILVVMLRTLDFGAGSQTYPPPAGTSATAPYPPPEGATTTPIAALQTEDSQRNATFQAEATVLTSNRIPAWTAQAQASVQPTSTPLPSGAQCFIDRYDHFSLWLPPGWRGMGENGKGTDIFYNYSEADSPPRGGFPPGGVRVDIDFAQVNAGQTFEQWYADLIARMAPDAPAPHPYELGKHKGYAQDLSGDGGGYLLITLPRDDGGVVLIVLVPADSPALSDALKMLSTLDLSGSDVCPPTDASSSIRKNLAGNAKLSKLAASPLLEPTCPVDITFPGTEAYNSTIKLEMPFRTGQTWTVGGEGSFYGNFHHCNYYNEYYATDWNRTGDNGSEVLAVASGYVSGAYFGPCVYSTTYRYGCYVDITHSSGYRTRYAHLSSVEVAIGQLVYTGDLLGLVGCSGNCDEAHLHLSFWHLDSGDYYSHCYNNGSTCPNGESPLVPQGYRPSPMMTANGPTTLQDTHSYTSINGQIYLPDLRNKDNIISVLYVRNDDNVYQLVPIEFYNSSGTWRRHDECMLDPNQWCWIPVNEYNRIASNSVGTAFVGGNGKVSVVVTQYRTNLDLYAAYNGVNRTSTAVHVPLLHKNNYGFYSYIFIQNTTASTASYTVYFKANTGTTCSKTYSSVQSHQVIIVDLKNDSLCIGSTFVGSAYITSNQPIAVTSIQYHWNGSQIDSLLESEYAPDTANTVFAPLYQNGNYGYNSSLALQNASGVTNNLTASYRDPDDGDECLYDPFNNIQSRFSAIMSVPPGELCADIISVLMIGGSNPVAATTNQHKDNSLIWSVYPAVVVTSPTVNIPLWYKAYAGWQSGLTIQNVNNFTISVYVVFYRSDGTFYENGPTQWLYPNAIYNITTLPSGTNFWGSAFVYASAPVAVQVNHLRSGYSGDTLMSHIGVDR